jgi:hypothetical protein
MYSEIKEEKRKGAGMLGGPLRIIGNVRRMMRSEFHFLVSIMHLT